MNNYYGFRKQSGDLSVKPMVLKDWAYEQIKSWILSREIRPGTTLVIQDLVNKLNISSTPIRDALLRLQVEGLVQLRPRQGFLVSEVTKNDLRNLFDVRILIEGYAAGKAALFLKAEDLEELDDLIDKCRLSKEGEFSKEFLITDQKFHAVIIESNQNPKLLQIVEMLQDLTYQEVALGATSFENVEHSCEEHKDLLQALHNRDEDEACRLMKLHLTSVLNRLLEYFDFPDVNERANIEVDPLSRLS